MKRPSDSTSTQPNKIQRTDLQSENPQRPNFNDQLVEWKSPVNTKLKGDSSFEAFPIEIIWIIFDRACDVNGSYDDCASIMLQINKYFESVTRAYFFHRIRSLRNAMLIQNIPFNECNILLPLGNIETLIPILTFDKFLDSMPIEDIESSIGSVRTLSLQHLLSSEDINYMFEYILKYIDGFNRLCLVNSKEDKEVYEKNIEVLELFSGLLFFLIANELVDISSLDLKFYKERASLLIDKINDNIDKSPAEEIISLLNENLVVKNLIYMRMIELDASEIEVLQRLCLNDSEFPIIDFFYINPYVTKLTKNEIICMYKICNCTDSEFPELWKSNDKMIKAINDFQFPYAEYMDETYLGFLMRLVTIVNSKDIEISLKRHVLYSIKIIPNKIKNRNFIICKSVLIKSNKEIRKLNTFILNLINKELNKEPIRRPNLLSYAFDLVESTIEFSKSEKEESKLAELQKLRGSKFDFDSI